MKQNNISNFVNNAKNIHNNKYDYSLCEYKNAKTKVKIICPEHGIFEQIPYKHLKKQGCPKCSGKIKSTISEFIKKSKEIHNDIYDYSLVNYINCDTKGEDCPNCKIKSKGEIEIKNILDDLKIEYIQQKKFKDCKNILSLPFDFYLPKHNILIEFDGRQHFNINTKYYTPQINLMKI